MSQESDTLHKTDRLQLQEEANKQEALSAVWNGFGKFAFRVAFIFFFLFTVPLTLEYYQKWFAVDWTKLHIRDIGSIGHYGINYIKLDSESGSFGIGSYANWGLVFLIALAGATVWTFLDKKSKNYVKLQYFITVAVRFTVLIQLNGLTFAKVFPTQMPALSLSQLNTPYGDFTAQKLYWIQIRLFAHGYEIFAGLAELTIMLLLFFRRTAALGAALALAMIGNITIANHTYDGGVHVLAAFHTLGAFFILSAYWPRIWNLIVKERDVTTDLYVFPFRETWQKAIRLTLKVAAFGIFVLLSGYLHWQNYLHDSYKVPARQGLTHSRGLYAVTEFKLNNKVLPYSPVDSVRWQEATFEKWSTFSFKVHRTFDIHGEAGRGKQVLDVDRTYESAGTGGGRRHYYYEADTVKQILVLKNKNKQYKNEELILHYERPDENRIILTGKNEFNDSIRVVLDKKDKIYPVFESRREPLTVTP